MSSTSIIGSYGNSSVTRFTGLASGMDTDALVKKLMDAEKIPYTKLQQKRQVLSWSQDAYREQTTLMLGFQSTYFNTLKQATNMKSANMYKQFAATSSDESVAKVSGGADTMPGTHTISVQRMATAAVSKTAGTVTDSVDMTGKTISIAAGDTLNISLGSDNRTITLTTGTYNTNDAADSASLINNLQTAIDKAFGAGKITAVLSSEHKLMLRSADQSLDITAKTGTTGATDLGIAADTKFQTIDSKTTVSQLKSKIGASGDMKFSINGEQFTFSDSTSLGSVMEAINNSDAGVKMSYDTLNNKFMLKSTKEGLAGSISLIDSNGILNKMGIYSSQTVVSPASSDSTVTRITAGGAVADNVKIVADANNKFVINYGGTDYTVTIPPSATALEPDKKYTRADFIDAVNTAVSAATSGKVSAANNGSGAIKFSLTDATDTSDIILKDFVGSIDALAAMGYSNNSFIGKVADSVTVGSLASKLSNGGKISFDGSGNASFVINGKTVTVNKNDTLSTLYSNITSSGANAALSYDPASDKFTLKSTDLSKNSLTLDDTSGLFSSLGISGSSQSGQDALVTIDGASLTKGSNTFVQDGVVYTLQGVSTSSHPMSTVTLTANPDDTISKVKDFVDKYNAIITSINTKITEKYDRSYQPLTDEQKNAMKDTDVASWEKKAKTGLLHNDPILQNVLYSLRSAISDVVEVDGNKYTLASIGVSVPSYLEDPEGCMNGTLKVDEDKLKNALQNNPNVVAKIFANASDKKYDPLDGTTTGDANRAERYKESGVMNRIDDILNDNVRSTQGKGVLLLKAGKVGGSTEYDNTIYNQMKEMDNKLYDMQKALQDKEDAYYSKFSKLESYMSKMNSQQNWLSQQLSKM